MQGETVFDLAEWAIPKARASGRAVTGRGRLGLIALLLLLIVGACAVLGQFPFTPTEPQTIGVARARQVSAPDQIAEMTVDDKSQIVEQGASAQRRNALIPFSSFPLEHAQRFLFAAADTGGYGTALKCLTQAIYYEAGFEPLPGRRAVAQVVLNRVKHPAFPKSVCGVVYQGSERLTGCQFSFTCDGALLHQPQAAAWREAEGIAKAALSGYVETSVGTATHYHADYVLPRWAYQLNKITQLGRHVFYGMQGAWGRTAAFSGRYSGIEQIPALNYLALRQRAHEGEGGLAAGQFENGLTVPPEQTDRHAPTDVAGRLDVNKTWRLSIPDPVAASPRYRAAIDAPSPEAATALQQNAAKEKGSGEAAFP